MNFVYFAVFCGFVLQRCAFAYISSNQHFEPCPQDSINVAGVCKCNYSVCDKPICATTLIQLTNFTKTPGSCCPTYSCEGCAEEDLIEEKCPCLPGAIIRSGRKCECADLHQTLINNTCVCDPNLCELPDLCDSRSVPVKESDGCCERVKCIPCPEDSYSTVYNDLLVEEKCVCYPCKRTECKENQRLEILMKGKNLPGVCCDIYNCTNIESNTGCLVNGTTFAEGETWTSGYDNCRCQNGIAFCSPINGASISYKSCLYGGKVYHHLDTWVEDTCTNCTCKNGESKCIAHMCDVHTSEVKKPINGCLPLTCRKVCEHGFKLNKQGCEICKCKQADKIEVGKDKYSQLDDLLNESNLTENDVVALVKEFIQGQHRFVDIRSSSPTPTAPSSSSTRTVKTSTMTPSTTICVTDSKNVHGDCTYNCILHYAVPSFAVGAIFGGIILFSFLKCSEKNRQKYKMSYNYKPVGKETVDKNLNFSPIIKSKNFELQSYNEKKNAI